MIVLLLAASGTGRVLLDVGRADAAAADHAAPRCWAGCSASSRGCRWSALAIGTALIPPLVALGGANAALAGTGLLLAFVLLFAARPLLRVDRGAQVPVVEISLLRSMALFEALPAPALEGLARALEPLELPAGTVVIREGDGGDRYYAIADGEVEVWRQGRCVARLGRGDGFGEIALLEEIPRTADVTAVTDVRLYALGQGAVRHGRRRLSARGAGRGRDRHARPRGPGAAGAGLAGGYRPRCEDWRMAVSRGRRWSPTTPFKNRRRVFEDWETSYEKCERAPRRTQ